MKLTQWLYVSRSHGCEESGPGPVAGRVANRDIWPGVTGMMVRADDWRAEWLEGGADDIAALRAETMADPELAEVITLEEGPMPMRRFGGWSLAYEGRAVGVEQIIAKAAAGTAGSREGLFAMLLEFSPGSH